MLLFFIAELALATLGFVFPQKVTGVLEKHLTSKLIEFYREDPDLQNIIDFTQQEVCFVPNFLKYWQVNLQFYFAPTSSNVVAWAKVGTWTGLRMNTSTAQKPTLLLKDVLSPSHAAEILQTLMYVFVGNIIQELVF